QVGAGDGRVRVVRRDVQQLRGRAGRRPRRAGRHVPAGLPTASRDADGCDPQDPPADPGHQARGEPQARDRPARGRRARRDADPRDEGTAEVTDHGPTGEGAVGPVPVRAEVVALRRGMFGAQDGGDTSGYGLLHRPVALPGASTRPYGEPFDALADAVEVAYPAWADAV